MSGVLESLDRALAFGPFAGLDVASVAWLVVAVALMVLAEFESRRARIARIALAPLALVLAAVFVARLVAQFGPMLSSGAA